MNDDRNREARNRTAKWADRVFTGVESVAYLILGALLVLAVVRGLFDAALQLLDTLQMRSETAALVLSIDRLLLVLMLVEILHTVGVSFRSHSLTAEPFLVVGLIASIRRMLVVTLESSQISGAGRSSAEGQAILHATMTELLVLGALILIMVISIVLLRRTRKSAPSQVHAAGE